MSMIVTQPYLTVHGLAPEMVEDDRLVLCDLDGCLISEGRAFEDTADFVRACGDRLWIVSNNSEHCAQDMSADLAKLGLEVPADRIFLAGEQTLHHLARSHPEARLALYGNVALEREARRLGFVLDAPGAELVLLCRDTRFSLDRLNALAERVSRGAEFWVANIDTMHPGQSGQPVAETGALLAAVRAMLGAPEVRTIGKPDPRMALSALARAGLDADVAVFVGDNPDTDGAVARATGMRFLRLHREEARA